MNVFWFQEGFHETFAEDPTCIRNCSIDGVVPACLTSLLKDYEDKGGICKDSLMDSEVEYTVSTVACEPSTSTCTTSTSANCAFCTGATPRCCTGTDFVLGKLDYSEIWKVSSTACTVSGTTNIGIDPTEKVPTITAGLCSQATKVIFRYNGISSNRSRPLVCILGDLVKFSWTDILWKFNVS